MIQPGRRWSLESHWLPRPVDIKSYCAIYNYSLNNDLTMIIVVLYFWQIFVHDIFLDKQEIHWKPFPVQSVSSFSFNKAYFLPSHSTQCTGMSRAIQETAADPGPSKPRLYSLEVQFPSSDFLKYYRVSESITWYSRHSSTCSAGTSP